MERVTVIKGNIPILVVSPHCDDSNTKEIAHLIADSIKCYCVTNNGWKRSDDVDLIAGKANCNNINHCVQDVVREEFLEPILGCSKRMVKDYGKGYVFFIHGMGQTSPDVILGYGEGSPPSYSCSNYYKDIFIKCCKNNSVYIEEAGVGSKYGGQSRSNLNQLFRHWFYNDKIQSMQLEIASHLRLPGMIRHVSVSLAAAMEDTIGHQQSYGFSEFTGI